MHVPPGQLEQRAAVNATDSAIPDDTLVSLFLRQAAECPGSPAVITSGRTLTYEQILRRARAARPRPASRRRHAGHAGCGGDGQGLGAGGRRTRCPAGGSGLPAGRPLPSGRTACLPAGARGSADRAAASRAWIAASTGRQISAACAWPMTRTTMRTAGNPRPAGTGPGFARPFARDLHLGLDRAAQGRHDRASQRGEPDHRRQPPAGDRPAGSGAGADPRCTTTCRSTTSSVSWRPAGRW